MNKTPGFSGEPLTRWRGEREMILQEDLSFIDPDGRQWVALKGSCLNGASIPQALWSFIGGPYSGRYRRASVVHDASVAELCGPGVPEAERRKADRMFYHACRHDGCTMFQAAALYIGVRIGSWVSTWGAFKAQHALMPSIPVHESYVEEDIKKRFWDTYNSCTEIIEQEDLDALDLVIEEILGRAY